MARFERIHNFRDYGGYQARHGRLVTGRLFRSGHHHGATPADLELFRNYQVATVIDLRGDGERSRYPCTRAPDFAADVLFAAGETDGSDPARPRADAEDEAASHDHMVAVYRKLPFVEPLKGTYRLFLSALAERPAASMVHCFSGKDRTGIAVALVHELTGVHHDDMMEDYLRSNDPDLIEQRMIHEAETVRASRGPISDAALRRLFSVHPEFLEAALKAIRERHGTVEAYAETELQLTPSRRDSLLERLLV